MVPDRRDQHRVGSDPLSLVIWRLEPLPPATWPHLSGGASRQSPGIATIGCAYTACCDHILTWQGSYPYDRGVGDDGRAGRPASFDLHFNKDAKNPRRAARSQTIHVRKDLSADRGSVSAHVDFDSIVPVQIVLKVVKALAEPTALRSRAYPEPSLVLALERDLVVVVLQQEHDRILQLLYASFQLGDPIFQAHKHVARAVAKRNRVVSPFVEKPRRLGLMPPDPNSVIRIDPLRCAARPTASPGSQRRVPLFAETPVPIAVATSSSWRLPAPYPPLDEAGQIPLLFLCSPNKFPCSAGIFPLLGWVADRSVRPGFERPIYRHGRPLFRADQGFLVIFRCGQGNWSAAPRSAATPSPLDQGAGKWVRSSWPAAMAG